jgi:hypothetical protein
LRGEEDTAAELVVLDRAGDVIALGRGAAEAAGVDIYMENASKRDWQCDPLLHPSRHTQIFKSKLEPLSASRGNNLSGQVKHTRDMRRARVCLLDKTKYEDTYTRSTIGHFGFVQTAYNKNYV